MWMTPRMPSPRRSNEWASALLKKFLMLFYYYKYSVRSLLLNMIMWTYYVISILMWTSLYVQYLGICKPGPIQAMMYAYILHLPGCFGFDPVLSAASDTFSLWDWGSGQWEISPLFYQVHSND